MRAERVDTDTLLAQIIKMLADAKRTRAPIQRIADLVALLFVPAVLVISLVTFVLCSLYGPAPRTTHALIHPAAC